MNKCVECQKESAHHWNSHLCWECYKKMFKENVEEDKHDGKSTQ